MSDKIREIIADITHNDPQSVTAKSSSDNLDGWDSVAQINIIVAVEEEFGVTFDAEEIHNLNSVEKIVYALSPIMLLRAQ
jgi:acyl carrier protein